MAGLAHDRDELEEDGRERATAASEVSAHRVREIDDLFAEAEGKGVWDLDDVWVADISEQTIDALLAGDYAALEHMDQRLSGVRGGLVRDLTELVPATDTPTEPRRAFELLGAMTACLYLTSVALRRLHTAVVGMRLNPGSAAARMLVAIGSLDHEPSNKELVDQLGGDESSVSRTGRRLREAGLATTLRAGGTNAWSLTPRGRSMLTQLRRHPRKEPPATRGSSSESALLGFTKEMAYAMGIRGVTPTAEVVVRARNQLKSELAAQPPSFSWKPNGSDGRVFYRCDWDVSVIDPGDTGLPESPHNADVLFVKGWSGRGSATYVSGTNFPGGLAGGFAMILDNYQGGSMPTGDIETFFEDDRWKNKVEGGTRASNTAATKAEAQAAGREMAIDRGVEHIVRNKDGEIGVRNTYPRSRDPRSSKG